MADYFLYHNVEEGRENKVCLYFEDQTYTYGETARMSNRAGNALRELGVEIEDRVLIVLPDCPEFVWTWFGAARIGAVITMVNPLLPAEDYKYYLDYTRARVAVIHESLLEDFREAAADARYLRAVLVVGEQRGQARHPDWHDRTVNDSVKLVCPLTTSSTRSLTSALPPTRIATTSRSGCSLPAQPAIRKAPCICNTICLSTPKSSQNARWA